MKENKKFWLFRDCSILFRKSRKVSHVGAVQNEYSLSVRSPELGLLQATKKNNTSLVAFSPLGRGLLTDKPPSITKA